MQRSENGKDGRDMNKCLRFTACATPRKNKSTPNFIVMFASRSKKKKESGFIIRVRNAIALIMLESF